MDVIQLSQYVRDVRRYVDSRSNGLLKAPNAMARLGIKENIQAFKIDALNILCGKTYDDLGAEDLAAAILQILAE